MNDQNRTHVRSITALMSVKNGQDYLPNARKYIARTMGPNDEIIVVDDWSDDQTHALLQDWARRDSRVVVLKSPIPGLCHALNFGLAASSNNWIARFDVDDAYPRERIEIQRQFIEENVVAIFTDYRFVDSKGKRIGVMPGAIFPNLVKLSLFTSRRTPQPSVLFDKSAVQKVGGYQQKDFPAEDLALWIRLTSAGNIISIPHVLVNYRLSVSSTTGTKNLQMREKLYALRGELNLSMESQDFQLNWSQYFRNYKEFSYAHERRLLAYLDWLTVVRISRKNIFTHFKIGFYFLLNPKTFLHLFKLIRLRYLKRSSIQLATSK